MAKQRAFTGRPTVFELLSAQRQVLFALMLRDIRTRFFGKAWGFLITIAWPLSHVVILLVINIAAGRTAPYGDSVALWFATGIVPFMAFSYMSRFIMFGIVLNRPLLTFPVLKITDILCARAIVEVLNAGLVVIILAIIFWFFDVDFMPLDVVQASWAMLAAMLLGLGVGVINAIVATMAPMWVTGYTLVQIILWMSAGIFFVPSAMPADVQALLVWHPVLHAVEWMRSAYYDGYGTALLDKTYLLAWGAGSLFVGLLLERLLRGRLLM